MEENGFFMKNPILKWPADELCESEKNSSKYKKTKLRRSVSKCNRKRASLGTVVLELSRRFFSIGGFLIVKQGLSSAT